MEARGAVRMVRDTCLDPTQPTHLVPVLAVLGLARLVVPDLAMHEEDDKVEDVEVRDRGLETSGEAPSEAKRDQREARRKLRMASENRCDPSTNMASCLDST